MNEPHSLGYRSPTSEREAQRPTPKPSLVWSVFLLVIGLGGAPVSLKLVGIFNSTIPLVAGPVIAIAITWLTVRRWKGSKIGTAGALCTVFWASGLLMFFLFTLFVYSSGVL